MADYFNTSIDYIIGYSDFPKKNERRFETSVNMQELELLKHYRAIPASQKEIIQVLIAEFFKNKA